MKQLLCPHMINFNMGCIETLFPMRLHYNNKQINFNMGCIETQMYGTAPEATAQD